MTRFCTSRSVSPPGKTKSAGEYLDQLPFWQFAQFLQFAPAPGAVIDLKDARLDRDGEIQRRGQRLSRLQTAQERARIDGGDGLRFEALGNLVGLFLSLFVQGHARCTSGERAPFGPFVFTVADQEEIGRARGFFFFAFVVGLVFFYVFGCLRLLCFSTSIFDQAACPPQGMGFRLCRSIAIPL